MLCLTEKKFMCGSDAHSFSNVDDNHMVSMAFCNICYVKKLPSDADQNNGFNFFCGNLNLF